MCLGGSPKFVMPQMAEPQEAPEQPAPQILRAPPILPAAPPEKLKQSRAKTKASNRRARAGGRTGKRRYTIPLSGTGGSSVSGVTSLGVNA